MQARNAASVVLETGLYRGSPTDGDVSSGRMLHLRAGTQPRHRGLALAAASEAQVLRQTLDGGMQRAWWIAGR